MAEEDLIEVRRQKAVALRELGVHPFGTARPVRHTVRDLLAAEPSTESLPEEQAIPESAPEYEIAGRAIAIRRFGKGAFLRLRDRSLEETQVFLSRAALSDIDPRRSGAPRGPPDRRGGPLQPLAGGGAGDGGVRGGAGRRRRA
jgi:lysyl-tRNA synthetase class II